MLFLSFLNKIKNFSKSRKKFPDYFFIILYKLIILYDYLINTYQYDYSFFGFYYFILY
jgi:hypothetical protein